MDNKTVVEKLSYIRSLLNEVEDILGEDLSEEEMSPFLMYAQLSPVLKMH